VLQQHLAQRLADRWPRSRTSPTIRRFVTGSVVARDRREMLRHGEQSEQTLSALKAVDDLLWSLKIPDHPQSRQRLIALLPGCCSGSASAWRRSRCLRPSSRRVQRADDDPHRGAAAGRTRGGRAGARSARGDRASGCARRWSPTTPPAAQLQRFGDRPVVDGDRSGRALPSGGDALEDDRPRRIDSLRAATASASSCRALEPRAAALAQRPGLFYLFAGESPWHTHSITGARSSGSRRPDWCSGRRPSRWCSAPSTA
jgi:hypothetical protein